MGNRRKPTNPGASVVPTYWNGRRTEAQRGTAVIADDDRFPEYWARKDGLIGKRVNVVRVVLDGVNFGGGIDYLYDNDGTGWCKVTEGHGSPSFPHASVEIEEGSFRPHSQLGRLQTEKAAR